MGVCVVCGVSPSKTRERGPVRRKYSVQSTNLKDWVLHPSSPTAQTKKTRRSGSDYTVGTDRVDKRRRVVTTPLPQLFTR